MCWLICKQPLSLSLSLYFTVPHVTSPFEFPMKETCWKTNRIHFHFKIQKRGTDGRQITSQQLRLAFKEQENSMALWYMWAPLSDLLFPCPCSFCLYWCPFMVDCHRNWAFHGYVLIWWIILTFVLHDLTCFWKISPPWEQGTLQFLSQHKINNGITKEKEKKIKK